MTRAVLLGLSVVCCAFGALALKGPESVQGTAYGINVTLAVLLAVLTAQDLRKRGWRFAPLLGATYILPLVGLVVYALASNRERRPLVT